MATNPPPMSNPPSNPKHPQPSPPEKKTSLLAILSLVLAILGWLALLGRACQDIPWVFGLPTIVVGLAALLRIGFSRGKLGGARLSVVSLMLGALLIIFALASERTDGRGVRTLKTCHSLDIAVLSYRNEYGHPPLPAELRDTGSDVEILTDTPQGIQLLTVLMGLEKESPDMLNPKKIRFLDVAEGKRTKGGGRDGIIYDSNNRILGLYDQWGHPYRILIDANDDDHIDNIPFPDAKQAALKRRAGTWSPGRDGKMGGHDDVKSW